MWSSNLSTEIYMECLLQYYHIQQRGNKIATCMRTFKLALTPLSKDIQIIILISMMNA